MYRDISRAFPPAMDIVAKEEDKHEEQLIQMIDEVSQLRCLNDTGTK